MADQPSDRARKAAADFHLNNAMGPVQSRRATAEDMRRGRYDDHATVQAFATFERETFAASLADAIRSGAYRSEINAE